MFIKMNITRFNLFNFTNIMKRSITILPASERVLKKLGENIKLARLRRKLSAGQVSERADVSRATLWQVEKGLPSVSMGIYCQVLFVLGLENDLVRVASDDVLGRKLQDAELVAKERAPKKTKKQ